MRILLGMRVLLLGLVLAGCAGTVVVESAAQEEERDQLRDAGVAWCISACYPFNPAPDGGCLCEVPVDGAGRCCVP